MFFLFSDVVQFSVGCKLLNWQGIRKLLKAFLSRAGLRLVEKPLRRSTPRILSEVESNNFFATNWLFLKLPSQRRGRTTTRIASGVHSQSSGLVHKHFLKLPDAFIGSGKDDVVSVSKRECVGVHARNLFSVPDYCQYGAARFGPHIAFG